MSYAGICKIDAVACRTLPLTSALPVIQKMNGFDKECYRYFIQNDVIHNAFESGGAVSRNRTYESKRRLLWLVLPS